MLPRKKSQHVYSKHNTTWKVLCTIFTRSLACIRNLSRSLRSLVRFLITSTRAQIPYARTFYKVFSDINIEQLMTGPKTLN